MVKSAFMFFVALALVACGGGGGGSSGAAGAGTLRITNTSPSCILNRLDVSSPEHSDDFSMRLLPGQSMEFSVPGDIEYDLTIQVEFNANDPCIVQSFLDVVIPSGQVTDLGVDASF